MRQGTSDVWINTTINWSRTGTHTADLSGIGTILLIPDLLNTVAEYLNLLEVQYLRGTCKTIWRLLEDLSGSRTRRALEPYFPGAVSAFADCLDQTGAIVGGSTALHVLCPDPGVWVPSDLDIVCSHQYCAQLVDFIVSQGYTIDTDRDRATREELNSDYDEGGMGGRNIGGKFQWRQFHRGPQTIDVSICFPEVKQMTPANFILTYHSSVVMQFITPRGIFCYFPSLTFNRYFLRNSRRTSPGAMSAVEKYCRRGYTEMVQTESPSTGRRRVAYLQDLYDHTRGLLNADAIPGIWFQKGTMDTSTTLESVQLGEATGM
jgi:hypothetical protein